MLLELEICVLCWHDTVIRLHQLCDTRQGPFLPFSSQICYYHKVLCDPGHLSESVMKVFMFPCQSLNLKRGSQVFRNNDFHICNCDMSFSLCLEIWRIKFMRLVFIFHSWRFVIVQLPSMFEQYSICQEDTICSAFSVIVYIFKIC